MTSLDLNCGAVGEEFGRASGDGRGRESNVDDGVRAEVAEVRVDAVPDLEDAARGAVRTQPGDRYQSAAVREPPITSARR